jgi:hypothetical protein
MDSASSGSGMTRQLSRSQCLRPPGLVRAPIRTAPHISHRRSRTLKEQCLWAELHDTIDQLRQAVSGFVDRYNTSWLIQRHGHLTPKEAYRKAQATVAA